MSKITKLFRDSGIGYRYYGVSYTDMAIELIKQDESRLYNLQHGVYEKIAEKVGCQPESVESDIRTVVKHLWKRDSQRLKELAGFELETEPSVLRFLEILFNYDQRS